MHPKSYRSFRVVQDGSSVRSTYLESCIHGVSRDVVSINRHNFSTKTPLDLHDPPILSQPKLLCARNQLSCFDNISEARSGLENLVPDGFMLEVYSATIYHPSVSSPTG